MIATQAFLCFPIGFIIFSTSFSAFTKVLYMGLLSKMLLKVKSSWKNGNAWWLGIMKMSVEWLRNGRGRVGVYTLIRLLAWAAQSILQSITTCCLWGANNSELLQPFCIFLVHQGKTPISTLYIAASITPDFSLTEQKGTEDVIKP